MLLLLFISNTITRGYVEGSFYIFIFFIVTCKGMPYIVKELKTFSVNNDLNDLAVII